MCIPDIPSTENGKEITLKKGNNNREVGILHKGQPDMMFRKFVSSESGSVLTAQIKYEFCKHYLIKWDLMPILKEGKKILF